MKRMKRYTEGELSQKSNNWLLTHCQKVGWQVNNSTLYNILFRNAGVGLQFVEPGVGKALYGRSMVSKDAWKNDLVVYTYRPTLREALICNILRFQEVKRRPQDQWLSYNQTGPRELPAGTVV